MRVKIFRVGSSVGVRLPEAEAFEEMARRGDDRLLDEGSLTPTRWERSEWEWLSFRSIR